MLLSLILACAPTDPSDPLDSKPGRAAQRWSQAVAAGDDTPAYAQLYFQGTPPPKFDQVGFGKRVDRLRLREEVRWTSVRYVRTNPELEGDPLGSFVLRLMMNTQRLADVQGVLPDGRLLELRVRRDGRVGEVRVASSYLVPSELYSVTPRQPPLSGRADLSQESAAWQAPQSTTLVLRAQAGFRYTGATFTVNSRCLDGERWMVRGIQSTVQVQDPGTHPVTLHVPLDTRSPLCELMVELSERDGRRQNLYCVRQGQLEQGPCPEQPERVGEGLPLELSEVTLAETSGPGVTIEYVLHPNLALPEPYTKPRLDLYTQLFCEGGQELEHSRPLSSEWVGLGEHRRLGSVFTEQLSLPCAVVLRSTLWDDYDKEERELWRGCLSEGALLEGAC